MVYHNRCCRDLSIPKPLDLLPNSFELSSAPKYTLKLAARVDAEGGGGLLAQRAWKRTTVRAPNILRNLRSWESRRAGSKLPRERPIRNSVFRLEVELDGRALVQQIHGYCLCSQG